MKKFTITILLMSCLIQAQETKFEKGSVIKNYGRFFNIQNPDFSLNPNKTYQVIFDIRKTVNDINLVNPLLDVVARYINMHVAQGVPLKNLKIVVVFHGSATKEVLSNKAYKEKFRKPNPNADLLHQLNKLGVKLYVCGQTVLSHNIKRTDIDKSVDFALSALSVLTAYQSDGYQLIDFN